MLAFMTGYIITILYAYHIIAGFLLDGLLLFLIESASP